MLFGFGVGCGVTYHTTMNFMGKFMESSLISIENSDAILIIHSLNRIREGKVEEATSILEHTLGGKLITVAYSKDSTSETIASKMKVSNMALEYWSKYPSAEGQDYAKPKIEEFVNGK